MPTVVQQDFYPDDVRQLEELLTAFQEILPNDWETRDKWLEGISLLANLADDTYTWLLVLRVIIKACKNPSLWKTVYPYLKEIQRPLSWKKMEEIFLHPALVRNLPRHVVSFIRLLCGRNIETSSGIFWPEFLYFLYKISTKKGRKSKKYARFLYLGKREALVWETYERREVALSCSSLGRCADQNFEVIHWGDRELSQIRFLEKLISYQGKELNWVWEFTKKACMDTGKIVLSLHNASSAASSGWGIPDFRKQLEKETLFKSFCTEVESKVSNYKKILHTSSDLRELKELWVQRIVQPKLNQLLFHLKVSEDLDEHEANSWRKWAGEAYPLCNFTSEQEDLERSLSIAPINRRVSKLFLQTHLAWSGKISENWLKWHALLLSVLEVGNRMVSDGRCSYLVVPWINKFFISSRREKDTSYLAILIKMILNFLPDTLIVVFDDTTRLRDPSLKLAIPILQKAVSSYGIQGVGIFGKQGEEKSSEDVKESIGEIAQGNNVLVTRPYRYVRNHRSLNELIMRRDYTFLSDDQYDSSWKDNTDFLYWGTSIFPLTNALNFTADFPPVIVTNRGTLPFGSYYRNQLIFHALGEKEHHGISPLFKEYGGLANLF